MTPNPKKNEYAVFAGDSGVFGDFLGRFGAFWGVFWFFCGVLAHFGGVLTGFGCVGVGSEETNTRGTRGKRAREVELSQTLKTPEIARRSGHWNGETPGYGDF